MILSGMSIYQFLLSWIFLLDLTIINVLMASQVLKVYLCLSGTVLFGVQFPDAFLVWGDLSHLHPRSERPVRLGIMNLLCCVASGILVTDKEDLQTYRGTCVLRSVGGALLPNSRNGLEGHSLLGPLCLRHCHVAGKGTGNLAKWHPCLRGGGLTWYTALLGWRWCLWPRGMLLSPLFWCRLQPLSNSREELGKNSHTMGIQESGLHYLRKSDCVDLPSKQ